MSRRLSEHCLDLRREAARRAWDELRRLGFTSPDGKRWTGVLCATGRTPLKIEIELTPEFPDSLPKVFLDEPLDTRLRAHVGKDRKVCIAPDSGLLLDTERPERLVEDTLELAKTVLFPAEDTTQRRDLEAEFQAYWTEGEPGRLLSICDPKHPVDSIVLAKLGRAGEESLLLAPDLVSAERWAAATRMALAQPRQAVFVRLDSLFSLPRYEERTSLRSLLGLVEAHGSAQTRERLARWLATNGLPAFLLLSAPLSDGSSDVVFAVFIPPLSGQSAKYAQHGFRPGHIPATREVAFARPLPVKRMEVARGDTNYLIVRGGGDLRLLRRQVTVIGCGAVGSHAAASLVASGIGKLTLIDAEQLESANIHRHFLGAMDLGRNKAEALSERLRERSPLAAIEATPKKIEDVLEATPEALTGADLVFIALGDETLELRLNAFLGVAVRRIHVWVEPLGLGGHVLATGTQDQPGCFSCLYQRNTSGLIHNMAGLAEPNQQFQESLGGCRGTFTPFGVLDAQRAAIEGVREAIRILTDSEARPALTSWVVSPASFIAKDFRLSARGRSMAPGAMVTLLDFARPDCGICASKTS